ncbi:ESX secretion-associated protein EspG [Saccharomonospora piscinae]|uniref:ESX secretion-associated protein EspG n=1 Tax=Saccharomonospora piscinae TaxID=687388 RepID=UPI0004B2FB7F|nr:ESX secretion-associated protein EspG [Saccharomonospora piscinae]
MLSSVEASVTGQALGADVRRFPLRLRNTTTDPDRLVKLTSAVGKALVERGLATTSSVHPAVRAAFGLFARHRVGVAVTGIDGFGENIAALSLTDGAQALGVTQHGQSDDLLFSLFSDDDLVDVVAGVLPTMPAAPGGPLTVRGTVSSHATAWEARKAAEQALDEEETHAFGSLAVASTVAAPRPARRGREPSAEERLREALAGPRLGGGYVTVSGHRAAPQTLSWLDTEDGRYLISTQQNQDECVATYEPAGQADVARAVRDALSRAY